MVGNDDSGSAGHRRPSVADELRREDAARILALHPEERVRLALALGERDLIAFAAASGLSRTEAKRAIERGRQATRRPSRCVEEMIG